MTLATGIIPYHSPGPDERGLRSTYSNSSFANITLGNLTIISMMGDKSIQTLCNGVSRNTSICNKQGLGISLSTPILMNTAGILGNMVALIVLYTARREMKKTMFYVLLSGLAGTDLLGQLLTGPIAIVVYANNLRWVGGDPLCKYHGFFMVCFGMITPLLVCCLSIERVIALQFPYYHERSLTKRRVVTVILGCWIFVLLFCCLPFVGFGSYEHQFPGSWCFLNFHKESKMDVAYAYMYAFINVVIIGVIIIGNSVVMVTLLQMKRRKLNHSPSTERRNGNPRKSKLKVEEETQMIWFLFAITIVFTTCWFPLNIHILINQVTGRVNYAADLIGVRLASINVILDPWLYILLRKSVIVKFFRWIKGFFIRDESVHLHQRSSRFVTNHTPKHSLQDSQVLKEVHELKAIDQTYTIRNELDKSSDSLETSSSSGIESDTEQHKKFLRTGNRKTRMSDSGLHDCIARSRDSFFGRQNGINKELLHCRKLSLPIRMKAENRDT